MGWLRVMVVYRGRGVTSDPLCQRSNRHAWHGGDHSRRHPSGRHARVRNPIPQGQRRRWGRSGRRSTWFRSCC